MSCAGDGNDIRLVRRKNDGRKHSKIPSNRATRKNVDVKYSDGKFRSPSWTRAPTNASVSSYLPDHNHPQDGKFKKFPPNAILFLYEFQ